MNKSQGTTVGAVLLAALMFRPVNHENQLKSPAEDSQGQVSLPGKPVSGNGPWLASCEYWAPERLAPEESEDTDAIDVALNEARGKISGDLKAAKEHAECNDPKNKWGVPFSKDDRSDLKITAVIATLPDPIHTSMPFSFDRTIDALMEAAADNGYVSNYYWLPWQREPAKAKGDETPRTKKRGQQEIEPGLIIFKPVDKEGEDFHSALYLFLVGESPSSGIDGYQIARAFKYERELRESGAAISTSTKAKPITTTGEQLVPPESCNPSEHKPTSNDVTIIGPSYSGSAASLRRAIDFELRNRKDFPCVVARGVTGTELAGNQMTAGSDANVLCSGGRIDYATFVNDSANEENLVEDLIARSSGSKVAVLIEDGTTFGKAFKTKEEERSNPAEQKQSKQGDVAHPKRASYSATEPSKPMGRSDQCARIKPPPVAGLSENTDSIKSGRNLILVSFPRGISSLRNAQTEKKSSIGIGASNASPSPYLSLTLTDANNFNSDSVPQLSQELSPISQEAQLMTIQRQLQRYRARYVVIEATNVLDQLFLAQFLHRALPDTELELPGADLLFEREIDDVPFIGAVTTGPYHLMGLSNPSLPGNGGRAFSDWGTEAYYNAASFILWNRNPDGAHDTLLPIAGFQNVLRDGRKHVVPPVWMTVVGSDGYYPLGVFEERNQHWNPLRNLNLSSEQGDKVRISIYPSLWWDFLCVFVMLLCVLHTVTILIANYWSPLTRDLDVRQNDQPHRRSMYINIGTITLFCMSFVVAWPLVPCTRILKLDGWSWILGAMTLVSGTTAVGATLSRTWSYKIAPLSVGGDRRYYNFFNLLAVLTGISLVGLWVWSCGPGWWSDSRSFSGVFFAYRCINPTNGVSPLVPILLLLFSWFLWSIFQTLRLRFSNCNRPRLPDALDGVTSYPLYVSDARLNRCQDFQDNCLYCNIESLLITRTFVQRFFGTPEKKLIAGRVLSVAYVLLFLLTTLLLHVRSVDRIVWGSRGWPIPYEFLVTALFFPLLTIALAGWLRMIFIWSAMKRGLLQPLETQPIRFAFERLNSSGWMSMFRQSGLREQWRDMARSTESMRQIVNDEDLLDYSCPTPCKFRDYPEDENELAKIDKEMNKEVAALVALMAGKSNVQPCPTPRCENFDEEGSSSQRGSLNHMYALETFYAKFAKELLSRVLIPYWKEHRSGLVDGRDPGTHLTTDDPHLLEGTTDAHDPEPHCIRAAEEFLVIRYVSLIRAVLVNLRYLMTFISMVFVFATIAWNSYPFQPRQIIDWIFTLLLGILGMGVVWVFAQMYRDPILSRITHTRPNELGWEFYVRIASFGIVPLLTWLAYNYPEIGGTIFNIIQPNVEVMK
jgi:hypothetical protein